IGILDHERPRIAEGVRHFEDLHSAAPQLGEQCVEVVDLDRNMVEDLPTGRNKLLLTAAPTSDALPGIPGHRSVGESHAALRLSNRPDGLERRPARLTV